ncbi:hypothetical protein W02_20830 [Nitrospira sp. KM1]|uniref:hypothetical protein n=1 Tax=Nitrospira sp. KM1 TaxID=1936990 RepID=UPI0013A7B3FD|nr:hypothetical protein [Nitrospira sp. KM1]BCA54943.1 hypothetical protein W02_20830 [Nitrospira sp. KM1]
MGRTDDPQQMVADFLTASQPLERYLGCGGKLTDPQQAALSLSTWSIIRLMAGGKRGRTKN